MNTSRLLKGNGGTRGVTALLIAGLFVGSMVIIGCQGSGSDADSPALGLTAPDDAAPRFAPPTLEELNEALHMTPEQLPLMEEALNAWTQAMQSRTQAHREKRTDAQQGNRGAPWDDISHEPAILGFIEASIDILEPKQFTAMADFFVERREAMRVDCPTDGRHRHGAKGNSDTRQARRDKAGEFRKQRLEKFASELNLTEEQQAALREIREEGREAIRALRAEAKEGDRDFTGRREKAREFREQQRVQMERILEPEQLARMEELKEQRRSEMGEKRQAQREQRHQRHIEFLGRILNLSDPQKQQVSEILNGAQEQMRAYREKMRDSDITREDARSEAERMKEQTHMAVGELLTPEQRELFTALQKLMPHRNMMRGPRAGHRR